MLRREALLRTDVSEERISYIIRVARFGDLGATLVVTATEARCVLQEPQGFTSQKTAFFIVTTVKTSNFT
jgi:hypothetical protein